MSAGSTAASACRCARAFVAASCDCVTELGGYVTHAQARCCVACGDPSL